VCYLVVHRRAELSRALGGFGSLEKWIPMMKKIEKVLVTASRQQLCVAESLALQEQDCKTRDIRHRKAFLH